METEFNKMRLYVFGSGLIGKVSLYANLYSAANINLCTFGTDETNSADYNILLSEQIVFHKPGN